MKTSVILLTALLLAGCQSNRKDKIGSIVTGSAKPPVTVIAIVKSYDTLFPLSHSSSGPYYQSVLEIVTPDEKQGIEIEIESRNPLGAEHLLRKKDHRVQFQISDFSSHRGSYLQHERWHVVYRFRIEEIRELEPYKEPNQTPEPTSGLRPAAAHL